jgi:hypothetical protein
MAHSRPGGTRTLNPLIKSHRARHADSNNIPEYTTEAEMERHYRLFGFVPAEEFKDSFRHRPIPALSDAKWQLIRESVGDYREYEFWPLLRQGVDSIIGAMSLMLEDAPKAPAVS